MTLHTMAMAIILIIAASLCADKILKQYIRLREKELETGMTEDREQILSELEKHRKMLLKLDERVQSLETLITDENYHLKNKFKDI